jgi:hypothetical protein
MRKTIITLVALSCLSSLQALAEVALQDNPPDRYVVKKRDTLWDIAGRFLKEPWRWPEIWQLNREQIKNPHLIYPGDAIVLDRSGEAPRLRLLKEEKPVTETLEIVKLAPRIRTEPSEAKAIPSIPLSAIGPFLNRPLVVDDKGLAGAATIIATEEGRVVLGTGNTAYVRGLGEKGGRIWHIYRPGRPLMDPDTGEVLGNEVIFLGEARVVRSGEPATVEITRSVQEINVGDSLLPAKDEPVMAYAPHAPEQPIAGRIVSIYGGVAEGARNSIVTFNKGRSAGIEIGHVLALYRHGQTVPSGYEGGPEALRLPAERYGLVIVFRTFDKVSYGLVVQSTRPVHVADDVRTP